MGEPTPDMEVDVVILPLTPEELARLNAGEEVRVFVPDVEDDSQRPALVVWLKPPPRG